MILSFRPIKVWPPGWDRDHPPTKSSPFSTSYQQTLQLLDHELWELDAGTPILQVDAPEARIRLDGQLHADARVDYPGVILSFDTKKHGTLTYPCNRFATGGGYGSRSRPGWHENLRAIALGLEALRKVERYGIAERGQQYAGYAELPSGIALGRVMTARDAWLLLVRLGDCEAEAGYSLGDDPDKMPAVVRKAVLRQALNRTHPDQGGNAEDLRQVLRAKEILGL